MYQFSQRFKLTTYVLMALGLLGLAYGFLSAPSTVEEAKAMVAAHDSDGHGSDHADESHTAADAHSAEAAHAQDSHVPGYETAAHADDHETAHDQHLLDQMRNRPWSAFYVSALFSFLIALGVLAFYAINRAAQAGWSPLLFRVMEGITSYLIPGGIILFVFLFYRPCT
jgi:hypothetical protein